MAEQYLLEMKNISKAFGGNLVLKDVSLCVKKAEVVAFLGENGAGKSTMIKILAGIHPKDTGQIFFGEHEEIENGAALNSGSYNPIAFIHQDLGLVDWMTIAENMAFSLGYPRNRMGLINWKKMEEQASEALLQIGVALLPRKRIYQISQAEKAIVTIARALATQAQLLVLDEPTASLPAEDVHKLFEIIHKLKERKVGVIYVTHRMDEVAQISDRVLIIRDGEVVGDSRTDAMSTEEMVTKIVGRKQADRSYKAPLLRGGETHPETVLSLEGFQTGEVGPISFELGKGELLGLVGLRGAGHEQISRSLFGLQAIQKGRVELCGKTYQFTDHSPQPLLGANPGSSPNSFSRISLRIAPRNFPKLSPQWAIAHGISLLAANRGSESLVMNMNLEENLFLNQQNHGYTAYQLYRQQEMINKSNNYIRKLNIHPHNPVIDISVLSGGNQQKVVLSRWLDINNDIMILEDPTAGVDVGARAEIYQIFLDILATGKSLLLISTDCEEVAKICSRVLVFNKNQISCELLGDQVTHENIFLYASN